MHIRYDQTPNPNALKFTFDRQMFPGRVEIKKASDATSSLLKQLISIRGVDSLFGYRDFLTINKTAQASWDELLPQIKNRFAEKQETDGPKGW